MERLKQECFEKLNNFLDATVKREQNVSMCEFMCMLKFNKISHQLTCIPFPLLCCVVEV